MTPTRTLPRPVLLALLASLAIPAVAGKHDHDHDHGHGHEHRQHGAHVHGVAELNVAVDADSLLVELNTPAMNIVGFEHPPRTAEQRAAIDAARKQLADGAALFVPNPEAECAQISHQVTLDLGEPEGHAHGHDHGHGDSGGDDEAHADAHAEWAFTCAKPASLNQLDVKLFDVFPGKEKLRVQLVTSAGQRGAELTPDRHELEL